MTVPVCYPPGADWSCFGTPEEIAALDPIVKERAEVLAWMTLAALTAYQVGVCPITVRPCRAGCSSGGTYMTAPVISQGHFAGVWPGAYQTLAPQVSSSGAWINACGCAPNDCSCTSLCEAILPGPVGSVLEVWLDGAVLSATSYRVDNGNRLVRTDGGCWPSCQDMSQDAHGDDAFSVRYYRGAAPNVMTLWAVGVLAAEFYLACTGKDCRLPSGVTNITRQGITMEVQTGLFVNGFTGIPEVDTVIALYNPNGLRAAPVVASPDSRRSRLTTWGR
ncbi:MAG TPA: hypothetical protein VFX15_13710 [Actinomycetes bacterium]|nr:hypothetical protein [Actinomycetes bacterium]